MVGCILLFLLVFGCQSQEPVTGDPIIIDYDVVPENNTASNQSGVENQSIEFEIITLSSVGSLDSEECVIRGLNDKVIMLESKYCGYCKKTLPDFKEACSEKGVEPIVLDLSVGEQRKQMESYGITITYTPTFIFGCDYFVGGKTKEGYLQSLDKFLKS